MDIINEYLEKSSYEDDICSKCHINLIRKSDYYIEIIDSIIGDMLMDKIYIKNDQMYLKINKRVLDLISGWYDLSSKLLIYNTDNITVYRGVSFMDISNNKIVQPIPFSSCIDFENALNWIHPDDLNSFIMKINIKSGISYTYTGNLNEGNEVVLPAGILTKVNVISCNIVEYDFEPFTYSQMIENFDKINTEIF